MVSDFIPESIFAIVYMCMYIVYHIYSYNRDDFLLIMCQHVIAFHSASMETCSLHVTDGSIMS
jgi:hypothetical protein